ncbi:peptidase [Desulfosarcina alkanivorans]|uniref:Peptidase n=1 Tax=Desulfosarcina alkanivorans TaxID=571177 RepID=A0A5K7YNA8_9BACT|nr:BtrH N-terminal domain-containing protein [Desulfosarcina alkanivorans]BBO69750.1 peptidase [Desulfosarcina alkanivorans]
MILLDVHHHPGRHCASTGIRNLVNYHEIDWSEAMCFGLGQGLAVWFIYCPEMSPSRIVHVRAIDFEEQFFNGIGHPFQWETFDTPEASEQGLKDRLALGVPVILRTDLFYLPYYGSNTHYPGHVITAWGYDPDRDVFLVTDTERTGLLTVPSENMRKARFYQSDFMTISGHMFSPAKICLPDNLPEQIKKAIAGNSLSMLNGFDAIDGITGGISGLRLWQAEISNWSHFEDWQWTARFLYQIIEKRGTGGGGFRFLFADFLSEAAILVPEITSAGLAQQMAELGFAWQALALCLKNVSEKVKPDFTEVEKELEHVADLEEAYHRQALAIFHS